MGAAASADLLVVRLSALGDVIHTVPAIAALREHFRIAWAVESPYAHLVETVAEVQAVPVSLKRWSARRIAAAGRAIRGPASAVDFQGLIKSALVTRLSGARRRFGFAPHLVRERPAAWLTNEHVRVDPSLHVIEWNRALARAVADAHGVGLPEIDEAALQRDFQRFAGGTVPRGTDVVLLAGAGRNEKIWPAERFRDLAANIGARALAVWGPGEEEAARAIGCRVAPKSGLRELASILHAAAVVIGGDTGPLHLAAALGTPVIGLYGPTNPRRNGPYGQLDRCISTFDSSKRMEDITVPQVLGVLEALAK